jgi:Rps23 Pro-64 3,4-dihydroxylase Tpa1-like proline 4-hydroxylase
MTAKQILDAFSETLLQDDRILSSRERELLMSLLHNAKAVSGSNPETQEAVKAAIARSVGETVAQRAFGLLGGSIVEQILARAEISTDAEGTGRDPKVKLGAPQPTEPDDPPAPPPPTGAPQPPGTPDPSRAPQPPTSSQSTRGLRAVASRPQVHASAVELGDRVGVLVATRTVGSPCVVLDEFLAPQELEELIAYTLQRESDFHNSQVISPSGDPGAIDYNHRRSRVLMDLGKHQHVILQRIRSVLPSVLDQLGIEEFPITHVEAQITASNDGDFFGAHSDDAHETIATRRMTFVYFFHREPCPFAGGQLRLHDPGANPLENGYQEIVPQQNQIVFFPCSVLHEITPVECPSRAFGDSRFTLNGWLHR